MISIIVPIYKVENYIKQCLDSIISQTYDDLEIILVDDGSPDNCPAICDEYAKKDNRIKVIHKQNGGLISARKAGLKASAGEYVCFVDGDDWIEPDMYGRIADAINKYSCDCVITQFYFSFPDKESKSNYLLNKEYYTRDEIEREIFPTMLFAGEYYRFGIYPCCWTKAFKRELLEKHLMDTDDRIRMGEDISFTYPCLMECNSIAFIDKPLYHYRNNPSSMTNAYDSKLPDIYFLPYQTLAEKCNKLGVDLSSQLSYYLLYLVNFVIRNEANINNPKNKREKNAVIDEILNNQAVLNSVKQIDAKVLPSHTKILALFIKKKRKVFLKLYIKLLKNYIK